MTKTELIARLKACAENGDTESAHCDADDLLIGFINDPKITEAYESVPKWYA